MNKKTIVIIMSLILCLGLYLRITGLQWGLTTTKYFHANSYHPDEADNFNAIRKFDVKKHDFRIKNYLATRGTMQIYMTAAWVKTASALGLVKISASFDYYKENPLELAKLFVSARAMSVFFALLTIITVYFLGKLFYGGPVFGLLAAFFMAIVPGHVVWSHYMGTDLILNFEISLILLFSFMIITKPNLIYLILAGVTTGLAVATKFSSAPFAVIPLAAYLMRPGIFEGRFNTAKFINKQTILYFLMLAAGFILGNPYSVLDPETIKSALRSSINLNIMLNGSVINMDCFEPTPGWIYYLLVSPKYTLGLPFMLLSGASIIYAFIKREKTDVLLLLSLFLTWALLGTSPFRLARWSVAFIPMLCLLSARFVLAFSRYRITTTVITAAVCLYTLVYSCAYVKYMAGVDVRDESSYWIENNIPEGSKIAVAGAYFWNPAITMTEYWYKPEESVWKGLKKYKIVEVSNNRPGLLDKEDPDYIAITDFEYFPILKLKNKYPLLMCLPILNEIMNGKRYTLIKKFERYPSFLGIEMMNGRAPDDWRYICPAILIYKKS